MIAIDTSALVAILLAEPEAEACREAIDAQTDILIAAPTLTEALMVERRNQLHAGRSADFGEGVMAFLQKRPAVFTGK